MRYLVCSLLLAVCARAGAPNYSASSLVNAASSVSEPLAPNSIATLYGTELSYETGGLASVSGSTLPIRISGIGVSVSVNGIAAALFYVSPKQINFLVPSILRPGKAAVQVFRDGRAGPEVVTQIAEASPGLFQLDPDYAVVTRADGSLVDRANPARPGEVVVLYATGLGSFTRPLGDREIPLRATQLTRKAEFLVLLDGRPVPTDRIQYAGAAPGFAGLYQINVQLPDTLTSNPELRVGFIGALSKPGVKLPAEP